MPELFIIVAVIAYVTAGMGIAIIGSQRLINIYIDNRAVRIMCRLGLVITGPLLLLLICCMCIVVTAWDASTALLE